MLHYVKPFAAIVTFVIGALAAYFLMPLPDIQVVYDVRFYETGPAPETVSVCELARRPERYDGKIVRVEANIEFNDAGASSLIDNACLDKWIRLGCDPGYGSCRRLIEQVRQSDPDENRIVAVGRFFASVLERVPNSVNTRVPLFEITETKGLEIKGGRELERGGSHVDPCKIEVRHCGHGSGNGDGSGRVTGAGSGRGTGQGSGDGAGKGSGQANEAQYR